MAINPKGIDDGFRQTLAQSISNSLDQQCGQFFRGIDPAGSQGTGNLTVANLHDAINRMRAQQIQSNMSAFGLANSAFGIGNALGPAPRHYDEPKDEGTVWGEVTGWRVWRHSHGRLYSYTMDKTEWPTDEPIEAHETNVNYGIHAFKTRKQAFDLAYGEDTVVGEIEMWGDTYEFDYGWHAQFAKVKSLWAWGDDPSEPITFLKTFSRRWHKWNRRMWKLEALRREYDCAN